MKLIVISSAEAFEDEPQFVSQLFENGLKYYHLRKPKFSHKRMEEYILQIPEKYRNYIVVHSHYDLAIKYDLRGIHLSRKKRREQFKKKLMLFYYRMRKPNIQISTSFHNLSSVFDDKENYSYAFLSPVFDSISKSGYQSAFTNNNLKHSLTRTKHKLIAFGGVDLDKVETVSDMKFDGLVLSGAIWQRDNKLEVFKEIKHKMVEMEILD